MLIDHNCYMAFGSRSVSCHMSNFSYIHIHILGVVDKHPKKVVGKCGLTNLNTHEEAFVCFCTVGPIKWIE